jgi:hypothetical protein
MKSVFNFVIGRCYHFQSSPLSSLCNGSHVSSTAGTDILELSVGWSANDSEFQRHPGNDTLLAVNSLSETGTNHKGSLDPKFTG